MYCLRVLLLFYINYMYIVYYSVYCDYFDVLTGHCVSELGHLSSYRNVWPEAV